MTPSEMARRAHANRTPEERKALAQKAQAAFKKKYGDKMAVVRQGKKL